MKFGLDPVANGCGSNRAVGDMTFVCQRCGACCRWPGSVLLEDTDIEEAAVVLGLAAETFIENHTVLARNRAQLTLRENADGSCEFLNPDGSCRIYAARPKQCRDFPHGWHVDGCPGLLS